MFKPVLFREDNEEIELLPRKNYSKRALTLLATMDSPLQARYRGEHRRKPLESIAPTSLQERAGEGSW